jgi:hypothetical protein
VEDDFEDYWATVRPRRDPPPVIDLRSELEDHSRKMQAAIAEMTERRSPPTSEVMFDDRLDSIRFSNLSQPTPEADETPRLYIDRREEVTAPLTGGGVLSISPGGDLGWTSIQPLQPLQVSGNSDFINLQDRIEALINEQANLLSRILSLEMENRELRARMGAIESITRNLIR